MAKKLNKFVVLFATFCMIFSLRAYAFSIEDLSPVEQEVAMMAVDNYIACGLTETEALFRVEVDLNAQACDQLADQLETTLSNRATNRWGISITDHEKELIARMVYLEAGNQTQNNSLGKKVVVAVVFNRMVDGRFGGTSVEDVLFAEGQFHTASSLRSVKDADWQAQIWVVDAVLNGDEAVDGMNFLYFRSSRPRGSNDVKIQDHWFS